MKARNNMNKVNVLGTEYTIVRNAKREEYSWIQGNDGCCDFTTKLILISPMEVGNTTMQALEKYEEKVIRHELIHAFLFESGLDVCSDNGTRNEELVDWIALQFPKMEKAFSVISEVMSHE